MQSEDPNEVKVLQDKLRQMESKMIDYRNNNSSLKQELRMAHKVFKTIDKCIYKGLFFLQIFKMRVNGPLVNRRQFGQIGDKHGKFGRWGHNCTVLGT